MPCRSEFKLWSALKKVESALWTLKFDVHLTQDQLAGWVLKPNVQDKWLKHAVQVLKPILHEKEKIKATPKKRKDTLKRHENDMTEEVGQPISEYVTYKADKFPRAISQIQSRWNW